MSDKIVKVGVSDLQIIKDPEAVLRTYGLGSCVGVIAMVPEKKVAGLLHYQLPEASANPEKASQNPAIYADTGIQKLIESVQSLAGVARTDLKIKIAGGSNINDPNEVFNIGKRNILAAKKTLWKLGLGPIGSDVGGTISRTLSVVNGTLRVIVSDGKSSWTI